MLRRRARADVRVRRWNQNARAESKSAWEAGALARWCARADIPIHATLHITLPRVRLCAWGEVLCTALIQAGVADSGGLCWWRMKTDREQRGGQCARRAEAGGLWGGRVGAGVGGGGGGGWRRVEGLGGRGDEDWSGMGGGGGQQASALHTSARV
ncbi:ran-binding protein [Gracilaria domingensis]|nr:ran-binding protein [Gracilaria domingensis]